MEPYRCGFNPNTVENIEIRRRFAAMLPVWQRTDFPVLVEDAVPGSTLERTEDAIVQIFETWFQYLEGFKVKLVRHHDGINKGVVPAIVFSIGKRGDGFDGKGGILAWCELPFGNDAQILCKFDPGEDWSFGTMGNGMVDFVRVIMHELGHGLGLDHSKKKTALMYPFVSDVIATPQLDDDITRLWSLYPRYKKDPSATPPTVPTVPPTVPPTPGPGGDAHKWTLNVAAEGDKVILAIAAGSAVEIRLGDKRLTT